ncbi:MAG: hypothetical protein GY814_03395, partial [Gammaproteobacteria bacterium]|nr:hypothetical protein [Gammaproteobacteria bacterium]
VEELLQPVSISSIVITQTVAPASPGDGWLWLNPTSGEFSIYTLGAWEPITYKSELADAVAGNLTAADVIDEDTMVSDDNTKVPTQQSVKAYVDAVAASKMSYRGGYDANSNTPNLDTTPTTVNKGDMYKVTIAGTFYTEDLVPGDVLIAEVINPTVYGEWTLIKSTI